MAEGDSPKPDPIDDLRRGFGLLFRAAKTTLEKLPTGDIEEAVITGAKEVGRALENVTHAVEEQFLGKPPAKQDAPAPDGPKDPAEATKAEGEGEAKQPASDEPREQGETKTRIG